MTTGAFTIYTYRCYSLDEWIPMKDMVDVPPKRMGLTSLSLSLKVLWTCLAIAGLLDVISVFEGLGFDPSFQLEAQPLFFVGMAATIVFIFLRAKIGPLLAGIIFWIPIVVLLAQVLLSHTIIPFGGDVVGISELGIAIVGVVAAHNVYHKLSGGWFRPGSRNVKRGVS